MTNYPDDERPPNKEVGYLPDSYRRVCRFCEETVTFTHDPERGAYLSWHACDERKRWRQRVEDPYGKYGAWD